MMNLTDLDPDDLIGAVKFDSRWRFFAGTVAEWILDYSSYDPSFDPSESRVVFRNNILNVDEKNAEQFCEAMEAYELSSKDVEQLIRTEGAENWPLVIAIDFDSKTYINGFSEISLHEYAPSSWTATEDNPINYVPDTIKSLWMQKL
jgi:hypothetical protein